MNPSPNIVAQQACLGLTGDPDLYGHGIRIASDVHWLHPVRHECYQHTCHTSQQS